MRGLLLGEYDAQHGGFGAGPKFPLAAPVAFALRLAQRDNDEAMLDVAITTLDRMGWDGLSAGAADDDAGAFITPAPAPTGPIPIARTCSTSRPT